jgi:hypothetical protein
VTTFSKQIRVQRSREELLGVALKTLGQPLARVGYKLSAQAPDHVVWTRQAPGVRSLWASPDSITMSFGESADGFTLLTIAGDAPWRIARDFQKLEL